MQNRSHSWNHCLTTVTLVGEVTFEIVESGLPQLNKAVNSLC